MDKCTSRSERPFLRSSSVHALVASWMSRSAPAACVAALLESLSSRVSDRMTSLREVPLVRVRARARARDRVRVRVRVRVGNPNPNPKP